MKARTVCPASKRKRINNQSKSKPCKQEQCTAVGCISEPNIKNIQASHQRGTTRLHKQEEGVACANEIVCAPQKQKNNTNEGERSEDGGNHEGIDQVKHRQREGRKRARLGMKWGSSIKKKMLRERWG